MAQKRVLSIQSHVVHGYVGNKASVFPLQLLGFDVDVVNSVHFSNHTGHPHGFEGDVLNGEQLRAILNGLERNGLLEGTGHLLTGYIGSASFLRAVLDVLKTLRRVAKSKDSTNDSHVRYVCDPVMGDAGKFYVPQELVAIYRDEVIPLADVVTPNQFEVEQLTGIVVKNIADAKRACQALHSFGPDLVFITSIMLEDDQTSQGEKIENEAESIAIIASRRIRHTPNTEEFEMWQIDSPIIPGRFTGTGDLCAALLLGHTAMEPGNLPASMEKVIGTMFSVIKRTSESSMPGSIASMELKLIQSKQDIESPPSLFKARKVL
mmetsp:Transcript_1453/g.2619  ORF Transcript_1453/g.2619 Transcript_1453/m.2619 type:complete len:321 (-) Transcript_1453:1059-2021(-)